MASDEEFSPLLPQGLHHFSMEDLKALVVEKFFIREAREELWNNFVELVNKISVSGLPCKIWVDGSFLTEKIKPNDVDFIVDFPISVIDTLTPDQKQLMEDIGNRAFKNTKKLHSFVMFSAPQGHEYFDRSVISHNQWVKDFGYSYLKKEPKGIAVVGVNV